MARGHPSKNKRLARELYCLDCLSFAECAKLSGVTEATLRAWAKKECWSEDREAVAVVEEEIRKNLLEARALALRKLLAWEGDKESALALSAVDKLEKIALAATKQRSEKSRAVHGKEDDQRKTPLQHSDVKLPDGIVPEERIALLEEGINRQVAYLLHQPVENLSEHIREIKAAMDVLTAIKGKNEHFGIQVSFDE